MLKLLIVNGANINMLGIREPNIYGNSTYSDLCHYIKKCAKDLKIKIDIFQSNHEGEIIDKIQKSLGKFDGIVINAGAYTHTSIAIMDALKTVDLPTVEVHLTDVSTREQFRQQSFISNVAIKVFKGEGFISYSKAMSFLKNTLTKDRKR